MNLLVYPKDMVDRPDLGIDDYTVEHIRYGLAYPGACDTVVYVDEEADKFKILKIRACIEYQGVVVDGVENLKNFV